MSGVALVIVESRGGVPGRACAEALGKARALGMDTVALVSGKDPSGVAAAIAPYAGAVVAAWHESLESYSADAHVALAARVAKEKGASLIVAPSTPTGRDLAARLAARLDAGYAADVVGMEAGQDGGFLVERPVFGGKAIARVALAAGRPAVITARAGAFPRPEEGSPGRVEAMDAAGEAAGIRARVTAAEDTSGGRVPVTEAVVVLSGGRGLGGADGFALLERLAARIGASVGASRAVVDAGLRDASEQVGKSGNTVAPGLYVAFGISGAVHHVMGMSGAGKVVVVNRDPNALFFGHADHGVVADALQILPALIAEMGG